MQIKLKLLSLDTSTTNTGYAVYEDINLVRYSSIDLHTDKDTDKRFHDMIAAIYGLIDAESPNVIAIEEMVVPRNPQTQRMLTMILGAVYGKCFSSGIHYCSLRPTQWRAVVRDPEKKLPRKREELKPWSIARVHELFGIRCPDDNISDAILIGKAFLNKNA